MKHKRMGTGARPNTLKTECGKLVAAHRATRWGPDVTCPDCLKKQEIGFRMPTAAEFELIEKQGKAADKATNKRARELAHIDDPICPDEEA